MASQKVLALREYDARKQISETIISAQKAGVGIGTLVPNTRFPDVGRVEELEYFTAAIISLHDEVLRLKAELSATKSEKRASQPKGK